jgi:hypothetical protein
MRGVAVLGHAWDVEHLRTERSVWVASGLENVQQGVVSSQPRQHSRLDLAQVTRHQHVSLGGHDRLAQE